MLLYKAFNSNIKLLTYTKVVIQTHIYFVTISNENTMYIISSSHIKIFYLKYPKLK